MKKFTKILGAAALLLCGLMISGCGASDIIKEYLDSTHRTWYKYNGATNLTIPLGADDNAETSTTSKNLQNAEIYVYYDQGLTVAVQSVTQTDIDMLGGLVTSKQDVVVGGSKKYSEEDFGTGKWSLLLAAANFTPQSSAPKIVSDPNSCVIIGGDEAPNYKIQWKKFLKEKIADLLLGE